MCLVRRSALEEVGGWAEWSLTEDAELAVRLHAAGYMGHVFADTYGRGLIPETLEGIKKQQFRWWAGPLQEFMVHWRLYLGISTKGRLSLAQVFFRFNYLLSHFIRVAIPVTQILSLFLCLYAILNDMVVSVPSCVLAAVGANIVTSSLKIWIEVKQLGGLHVRDYVITMLLKEALQWIAIKSFIVPIFHFKLAWIRTDKFEQSSNFVRAFHSSRTETLIALAYFTIAVTLFPFANFKHFDFVTLVSIWMLLSGFSFISTLIMAMIAERAMNRSVLSVVPNP
jgi:hypothetical protein